VHFVKSIVYFVVKKVKTFRNFNLVYYQIITFFAPYLEVFLHFEMNHKFDNQYVIPQNPVEPENFRKLLPFATQSHPTRAMIGYEKEDNINLATLRHCG
jgi:hypothetical protein